MAIAAYEVVFSGVLAGQFVQTVQHMQADEPSDNGAFVTARELISVTNFDGIVTAFLNALPAAYTLTSVRCRRVFPAGGPTAITLADLYTVQVGQRSGNISAAQVNPVILWIAGTLESNLGKLFMPGISEDDIDNMAITGALVSDYVAFIDAWIDGFMISAVEYTGSIATRATASPYNITAVRKILYGQVSPLIGTQRRRLRPV